MGTTRTLPLPCPLPLKLGCLLFSIGSLNSGTTLHGGIEEEKLYFSLLKSVKHKKVQFRAKCLNSFCRRLQSENTVLLKNVQFERLIHYLFVCVMNRYLITDIHTKRAYISQHDFPPLSATRCFVKSSPYHTRSSCPLVTNGGLERASSTNSGESES